MTEAVIVATARSPIGRAFKGSLTTIRPDDLTRQMVATALALTKKLGKVGVVGGACEAAAVTLQIAESEVVDDAHQAVQL